MRTRLGRDARLLLLFAVLTALPLAIWAYGEAGDEPGGPNGPGSVLTPSAGYQGGTVTASVKAIRPAGASRAPGDAPADGPFTVSMTP